MVLKNPLLTGIHIQYLSSRWRSWVILKFKFPGNLFPPTHTWIVYKSETALRLPFKRMGGKKQFKANWFLTFVISHMLRNLRRRHRWVPSSASLWVLCAVLLLTWGSPSGSHLTNIHWRIKAARPQGGWANEDSSLRPLDTTVPCTDSLGEELGGRSHSLCLKEASEMVLQRLFCQIQDNSSLWGLGKVGEK